MHNLPPPTAWRISWVSLAQTKQIYLTREYVYLLSETKMLENRASKGRVEDI